MMEISKPAAWPDTLTTSTKIPCALKRLNDNKIQNSNTFPKWSNKILRLYKGTKLRVILAALLLDRSTELFELQPHLKE